MKPLRIAGLAVPLAALICALSLRHINPHVQITIARDGANVQFIEHQTAQLLACHRSPTPHTPCGRLADVDIAVRERTTDSAEAFLTGVLDTPSTSQRIPIALHLQLTRTPAGWRTTVVSP